MLCSLEAVLVQRTRVVTVFLGPNSPQHMGPSPLGSSNIFPPLKASARIVKRSADDSRDLSPCFVLPALFYFSGWSLRLDKEFRVTVSSLTSDPFLNPVPRHANGRFLWKPCMYALHPHGPIQSLGRLRTFPTRRTLSFWYRYRRAMNGDQNSS